MADMRDQMRKTIFQRFNSYVNSFRDSADALSPMLQLKLTHTMHVVKDIKSIMQGEGWSRDQTPTGEVCALLHDIGRFSQFKEFATFRDSDSVDHAQRGIEVISEINILDGVAQESTQKIIDAIKWHNKKALPDDMPPETASLAHLVRDADKLDIFRVMKTAVEDGSIENNPEITWGLDIKGRPNPEIVKAIDNNEPICYTQIKSLADFILIQVGWVIGGFHHKTALKIIKERNVVEFRRNYLKTLTSDPAIDRCCDAAEEVLAKSI